MLNISSTQPVIWPPASAPGAASVPAVTAVMPVQSSGRDAQAGLSQGREHLAPASLRRGGAPNASARQEANTPEAAPLLPRESPDAPGGQASPETTEAQEKAEAQVEAQAEEKPLKLPLQDVLSSVWKASAAVVDVVLGRDASMVEPGDPTAITAEKSRTSAVKTAALQETLGATLNPAANDALLDQAAINRSPQDVMAYDAQGNSSWAPVEAGSLLSRRV